MDKTTKVEILLGVLILLVAGNFFVWKEVWGLGRGLEVVFFDVGQGDAIWVKTERGHQILIDGGPSGDRILEKLSGEMPFWDRTIDLVILTHPDYDHLRGLLDVLERYEVSNILWTGVLRETKTFDKWLEKLEQEVEQGANIVIAQKGQVIRAGHSEFFILHPFENLQGKMMEKSSNDSSIVAKLVFHENSFLFTGDITKKVERQLLELNCRGQTSAIFAEVCPLFSADILKVAHHGSKSADSKEFLQIVSPEIAVISCGRDNRYEHPHQEVLSNLAEFGIKALRTDQLGNIKFQCSDIVCQKVL